MSTEMAHADIRIGTSGWSYDDWVGPFYPQELRTRKSDWLAYYGRFFDTVEINSTFYRMPNEPMVKRWINVGSKLEAFEFSLKLPQSVTHETLVEAKVEDARQIAGDFEKKVVQPLAENDLMGCILIQLSPYFRRYDQKTKEDNLERFETLFKTLNYSDYRYVAEFRHSSWLNDSRNDLSEDTLKLLREYNIGLCKTDGPGFPITKTDTAPHSYIRFHGRNSDIWFKGRKYEEDKKKGDVAGDKRFNRYDYTYSKDELNFWVPVVKNSIKKKDAQGRLYFNNHPHGQAVQNAFMMMDLVGLPRKVSDFKMQRQHKIDSF
jgi:uncharacterized protein YecE (DUF72 family)